MGKGVDACDLFDFFAQEHFLTICFEEIKAAVGDKTPATIQEADVIAVSYVKGRLFSEHKPQREGQKPRVKRESLILSL